MNALKKFVHRLRDQEDGQGLVEYSLILALVSVAAIGTMTTMGTNVKSIFTAASTSLSKAGH